MYIYKIKSLSMKTIALFSFIVFFSFSTAAQQDDIKLKIDSLNAEIELLRSEYLSNNVKTTEQLIKDLRKSRSRHLGGVALGSFMSGIGIGLLIASANVEDDFLSGVETRFYQVNGIGLLIPGSIILIHNASRSSKEKQKLLELQGIKIAPNSVGMVMRF
jgi:hypothetical protein